MRGSSSEFAQTRYFTDNAKIRWRCAGDAAAGMCVDFYGRSLRISATGITTAARVSASTRLVARREWT